MWTCPLSCVCYIMRSSIIIVSFQVPAVLFKAMVTRHRYRRQSWPLPLEERQLEQRSINRSYKGRLSRHKVQEIVASDWLSPYKDQLLHSNHKYIQLLLHNTKYLRDSIDARKIFEDIADVQEITFCLSFHHFKYHKSVYQNLLLPPPPKTALSVLLRKNIKMMNHPLR